MKTIEEVIEKILNDKSGKPIFVFLYEYCLKQKKQLIFNTKFIEYPVYAFQTEINVDGNLKGYGNGRSKKISKDNAALDVLIQLSINEPTCLNFLSKNIER